MPGERMSDKERLEGLDQLLDGIMDYILKDYPGDSEISEERARELFLPALKNRLGIALIDFFTHDVIELYIKEKIGHAG